MATTAGRVTYTTEFMTPRTIAKINRLHGHERKAYVQDLIGRYEEKRNHIARAARRLRQRWIKNQAEHFDGLLKELYQIMESERT